MPKLTVTFSNAPPPNEPLMSDQPGSSSVPCTLSRKLNNEELRSYLHARYSDLGELLLPHADGDLLYLITVKPSRWSDAIATVSGYFFPGAGGRTRGYGVSISPLGRRGGYGYLPPKRPRGMYDPLGWTERL